MKRLLLAFTLLVLAAVPFLTAAPMNQPLCHAVTFGFPYMGAAGAGNTNINAAATWIGSSFAVYDSNIRIKEVKYYINTVTGSPAASDITCTMVGDGAAPQGVGSTLEGPISCDAT